MVQVNLALATVPAIWTGAEQQSFTEFQKSHLCVSLMDFIPEAQRAAIRNYTSTFNCDSAWTEALAVLPNQGGMLFVPAGLYNFTTTKNIYKRIYLFGEGGGFSGNENDDPSLAPSRFVFAANKTGLIFHDRDTKEDGILSPLAASSSAGSMIQGLYIKGSGSSGFGIQYRVTVFIRECTIHGFGTNGVQIRASINWTLGGNTDPTLYGSANQFHLSNLRIQGCGNHGVHCQGQDSNAGTGINLFLYDNGGTGINDESFLGNTWIGCRTKSNAKGFNVSASAQQSEVFACSTDSGEAPSTIGGRCGVVGGRHGAGFTGFGVFNDLNGALFGDWAVDSGFIMDRGRIQGGLIIGQGATPDRQLTCIGKHQDAMIAINREGDHAKGYRLACFPPASTTKTWDRMHGTTVVESVQTAISSGASAPYKDENGTAIAAANLILPRSFWLPSLSDAGEYRQYRFETGDKAAASISTAGSATYTAAQILGGAIVRNCNGADRTDTLPTAALLVAGCANTPVVGQIIKCLLTNGSATNATITLLAGTGGSFDTNQTAASRVVIQNTSRWIRIRLTNVSSGLETYQVVM